MLLNPPPRGPITVLFSAKIHKKSNFRGACEKGLLEGHLNRILGFSDWGASRFGLVPPSRFVLFFGKFSTGSVQKGSFTRMRRKTKIERKKRRKTKKSDEKRRKATKSEEKRRKSKKNKAKRRKTKEQKQGGKLLQTPSTPTAF